MTIQIDKIKGPLLHKHKAAEGYGDWKIKTLVEAIKHGYGYNGLIITGLKNVAAIGAHVPTHAELSNLINHFGIASVAAKHMADTGPDDWNYYPGFEPDNISGLAIKGSGIRSLDLNILSNDTIKNKFGCWSSSLWSPTSLYYLLLDAVTNRAAMDFVQVSTCRSIRLVIDTPIEILNASAVYVGNDGRRYKCVLINGKWWMAENLAETLYRDLTPIPEISFSADWDQLNYGARYKFADLESNAFEIVGIETLINSHDIVEFVAGENIKLGLIDKTLTIESPGGRVISDIEGLRAELDALAYTWKLRTIKGIEAIAPTLPTAAELLVNKTYGGYSKAGAKVYKLVSGEYVPDTDIPVITTDVVWKNNLDTLTNGPMNRCAVWSSLDATSGQYIGFGREVIAAEAKIYYIGVGADNYMEVEINSNVVKTFPSGDTLNDHYESWHLLPVMLQNGKNIIHVRGYNDLGFASIGVEMYDATLSQLQNVATIEELNALTIFSTKTLIGSFVEEGNFGTGYTCADGYSLINRAGVYSCERFSFEEITVNNHDLVEFKKGTSSEFNIYADPLDPTHKIIEHPASDPAQAITSADGSVNIVGSDLSVNRPELELFANNETELLAAWAIATASVKAARIFITGNITFTADRQFIRAYGLTRIKMEAVTAVNFYADNFVIDFNNIDFANIWFRTTAWYYFRLVGGYASFNSCVWPDDTTDTGGRKRNIVVTGPIANGTAAISIKAPRHNTQNPASNGADLIQPFWIENQADYGVSDSARIYVEILEMSASYEFARFSRVLLTSTVINCPFSVTGDESWFYVPEQALPGIGTIKATANILKTTTVDKFNAARLVNDDTVEYIIGMKPNGDAVKRLARSDDWYGIQWDTNISSPLCTRIGSIPLHRELPIQSQIKGCLLLDNGQVNYYLDPLDWTKRADGTASSLTGTDGQVMIEIPSHYRKFESSLTLRKCKISDLSLAGYTYVPKFYIGAYEGAVQRSASKLCSVINPDVDFRGGDNNATWDALTKTFLGRPATTISRIDFRTYARNRGSVSWNALTYDAYKSLFWLYFVEYANLNSQSVFSAAKDANGYAQGGLGNGVTDIDGAKWSAWNGYNPFIPCGHSNSLGNASGEVSFNIPADYDAVIFTTKVNRYRGVENPFGHVWKWIDGVNIEFQSVAAGGLSKLWVCSNPANFSNVDYVNYTLLGNMARVDGYIKEMMFGEIMPSITGGGSTTYWSDFGYCANIPAAGTEVRGVLFSGNAYTGSFAGFGYSNTDAAPSYTHADIGSRLCFLGV